MTEQLREIAFSAEGWNNFCNDVLESFSSQNKLMLSDLR
jgi:hypothetical protein